MVFPHYCVLVFILNLFEEIEFFKNINSSLLSTVLLTFYIPNLIFINLMAFAILSAMALYFLKANNDLCLR